MAFACDTEEELAEKRALIPDDIDILVTHGPQYGKFDSVDREDREERVGSTSLTKWIANHVDTVKLHVCGHIHEGYGVWDMRKAQEELNSPKTPIFVNCSHVNEHYEPVNKPIRVIL
jgi:Icc-related predicted phosphoesterase